MVNGSEPGLIPPPTSGLHFSFLFAFSADFSWSPSFSILDSWKSSSYYDRSSLSHPFTTHPNSSCFGTIAVTDRNPSDILTWSICPWPPVPWEQPLSGVSLYLTFGQISRPSRLSLLSVGFAICYCFTHGDCVPLLSGTVSQVSSYNQLWPLGHTPKLRFVFISFFWWKCENKLPASSDVQHWKLEKLDLHLIVRWNVLNRCSCLFPHPFMSSLCCTWYKFRFMLCHLISLGSLLAIHDCHPQMGTSPFHVSGSLGMRVEESCSEF